MAVVPVGVDGAVFRPMPARPRVPGRIMTTASSDVPMKGLVPLLEALAKVRTRAPGRPSRGHRPPAGREHGPWRAGPARARRARCASCRGSVTRRSPISTPRPRSPSCRRCTRASRCRRSRPWLAASRSSRPPAAHCPRSPGRAVSQRFSCAPNDPGSLAQAIVTALGDPMLRLRLGEAGRKRAAERFTWPVTARATAEQYFELLAC